VNFVEALEPVFGRFDPRLARHALEQRADDDVRFELAVMRQQFQLFLVELADDARRVGAAVQHLLGEHFEEGALFLDDEDLFQTLGEIADHGRLHRETQAAHRRYAGSA
jgi:hypothetical protein